MSVPEFQDFIQSSSLPDGKKSFWVRVLEYMTDDETAITARFVNGDQKSLMFYTDMLIRKYEAFKSHDQSVLNDIIVSEKAELASI